jgi:hypothetical protein
MDAGPDVIEIAVAGQQQLWGLQGFKGEVEQGCAF